MVRDGVYFPCDTEELPSGTFISAIQYSKTKGIEVIAGCDINAHHICWESSNINARGLRLLDYLVGTDLQILNLGNEPAFFNVVRREVIDITVPSLDITDLIEEWTVSNNITLSDHRRIDFVMAPGNGYPGMAHGGQTNLRASICGRSSRNNY